MATKDMTYDHPTYTSRQGHAMGEAGGAATTAYAKFCAFTAHKMFTAQLTVTTAGTATAHGFQVQKISGTSTTALTTQTIGTAVAGTTYNVLLTTAAGGVDLIEGDILQVSSLADAVGKAVVAFEGNVTPGAVVTI